MSIGPACLTASLAGGGSESSDQVIAACPQDETH